MHRDLPRDIHYTLRSLARTPVWTATLVLTIALGIGSAAAVQGFVRGLLSTDLPILAIERVVTVFATDAADATGPVPFDVFTALKARSDVFESLAVIRDAQERVSFGSATMLLSVAEYSPDAATVFPFPARSGATLSHRLRFAQFPANTEPIGRTVHISGRAMTIAGSLPYWLEGVYRGRTLDLWIPVDDADRKNRPVWIIGRLRPEMSVREAQAAVDEMVPSSGERLNVLPYTGQMPDTAGGMRRIGALLQIAAIAVFLIACANVAAFVLARSWTRARETAVRVAIGARRRQLLRQLLIDSAVISLIGGLAGFVAASWMADIVPLMFFDQDAERLVFSLDGRAILLTSILSIVVTTGCGLVPLFEIRDDEPAAVLQREIAGPSRAMTRVSSGLILAQMSACALLVISAGLLVEGFRAALDSSAGRASGNPVLVTLEALPAPSPDDGRKYYAASLDAVSGLVPVAETVWAARLPGLRAAWQHVRFEPPGEPSREVTMPVAPLTPEVLKHATLPPSSGRLFPRYDERCRSIVLSEAAAAAVFDGHPIGRTVDSPASGRLEVIGVLRSAREAEHQVVYDHPGAPAPLGVNGRISFLAPAAAELEDGVIDINIVSPNYFGLVGATLVAGQSFEDGRDGCRVGIVNEQAASQFFAGNAVGGAVIDAAGRRTEIVGVVRTPPLSSAQRRADPTLFLPSRQDYLPRMTAVLPSSNASDEMLDSIRARISKVPGGRPERMVVTTLHEHLSSTALANERIAATLVVTFTAIAVGLGAIGLYGSMADSARRRRREFAMRLALGAQGWRVVRLVMGEGLQLAAIGVTAGMLGSVLVSRWLKTLVPTLEWPSPLVWLAAPAVLAATVVVASAIPARRAVSVDLVSLLRDM